MRGFVLSWLAAGCLLLADSNAALAQPVLPPADAQKVADTKSFQREGASLAVSYTLALIATIIVMVLVCMPARRE